MKQTDRVILQELRENARSSLTGMSKRTGIPVSTIFDRIRSFDRRIVRKFTALVDFAKLGYNVRASVFLKVEPKDRDAVRAYLLAHGNVNTLVRVNNGYDYSADCVFVTIKEAEEFLEQLEMRFSVQAKQVYHIIDDIAREKLVVPERT